jgi:hypothetical protein
VAKRAGLLDTPSIHKILQCDNLEILAVNGERPGEDKLPGPETRVEPLRRGAAGGQRAGRHRAQDELPRDGRREAALTRMLRLIALLEHGLDQAACKQKKLSMVVFFIAISLSTKKITDG